MRLLLYNALFFKSFLTQMCPSPGYVRSVRSKHKEATSVGYTYHNVITNNACQGCPQSVFVYNCTESNKIAPTHAPHSGKRGALRSSHYSLQVADKACSIPEANCATLPELHRKTNADDLQLYIYPCFRTTGILITSKSSPMITDMALLTVMANFLGTFHC